MTMSLSMTMGLVPMSLSMTMGLMMTAALLYRALMHGVCRRTPKGCDRNLELPGLQIDRGNTSDCFAMEKFVQNFSFSRREYSLSWELRGAR